MAENSDFEWNGWNDFLNDDAANAFDAQADELGMQEANAFDTSYQPIETFPELSLDHPYLGHPYIGHEVFSATPVLSNDTLRCFPPASTGLAAEIVPGSTAPLADPGRINPFQNTGSNQPKLSLGRTQPNDSNDMLGNSLSSGVHVDTEARSTLSLALPALPAGKPHEADDNITVADLDRCLHGINHTRGCTCMNCLDYPSLCTSSMSILRDQFPALLYFSCRVKGCAWRDKLLGGVDRYYLNRMQYHEESHFREETRDEDRNLIFTCKDNRCHIRTKRKNDVKRHYATVHCEDPERFPCHVIGCPFSGDNGFVRKDKLTSHMKSTHKGLPHPGKRLQAIKPKTGVSNAGVHKAGSQA